MGLTDRQQALWMALIIVESLLVWLAAGAPTDKAGVILLVQGVLVGLTLLIKELMGGAPPKPPE